MTATMSLDDWRTLIALRDHGTVTKTAAALGISQSAVSHRLSRMPERFFVSGKRRVHLTGDAVAACALAERALKTLADAESGRDLTWPWKYARGDGFVVAVRET